MRDHDSQDFGAVFYVEHQDSPGEHDYERGYFAVDDLWWSGQTHCDRMPTAATPKTSPSCDFSGGYCQWFSTSNQPGHATFVFERTTPSQSEEAEDPGPATDIEGGKEGHALVILGRDTTSEHDRAILESPDLDLWDNSTKCFQFWMQFVSANDIASLTVQIFERSGAFQLIPWTLSGESAHWSEWTLAQFPINPVIEGEGTSFGFKIMIEAVGGPNEGGYAAIDNIGYGPPESADSCLVNPPEADPDHVPSTCTDDEFECHDGTCIPNVN